MKLIEVFPYKVPERFTKKTTINRSLDEETKKTCVATSEYVQLMIVCDTNLSGTLSLEEVLADACAKYQVKKMKMSMSAALFGQFDANGDGELDQDEMKAIAATLMQKQ